jgi:FeS assembly SUF system protein
MPLAIARCPALDDPAAFLICLLGNSKGRGAMSIETDAPVEGTPLIRPSTTDHPLYDQVVEGCRTVYDPEIPVNIYDLGLVYTIEITPENDVNVAMTLTAPGCPVAGEMPGWVENAVGAVEGVSGVEVSMVFDPPWTPDRMSEEAQVAVGWY